MPLRNMNRFFMAASEPTGLSLTADASTDIHVATSGTALVASHWPCPSCMSSHEAACLLFQKLPCFLVLCHDPQQLFVHWHAAWVRILQPMPPQVGVYLSIAIDYQISSFVQG